IMSDAPAAEKTTEDSSAAANAAVAASASSYVMSDLSQLGTLPHFDAGTDHPAVLPPITTRGDSPVNPPLAGAIADGAAAAAALSSGTAAPAASASAGAAAAVCPKCGAKRDGAFSFCLSCLAPFDS
ncbi:MAG: hypothetical protein ACRD3W_06780, partial [Terriglobales bacterium]